MCGWADDHMRCMPQALRDDLPRSGLEVDWSEADKCAWLAPRMAGPSTLRKGTTGFLAWWRRGFGVGSSTSKRLKNAL